MRATSTVSSGASATTNRRCSAGATQRVLFYRGFFRTFWRDDLLWGFARRDVFDDEDALAGLDQAELTPGDLLDRRGILTQPPRLVAQLGVFRALTCNRGGQLVVLLPCAQHREQAAVADEPVDDNDRSDKEHEQLDDAPVAGRALGRRAPPPLRLDLGLGILGHAAKQYNNCSESTSVMDELILILTTMPDDDRAAGLARTLVEERLAACVNVLGPMTSTYRWEGRVEVAAERQVVMKTTRANLVGLADRLRALHPYDLPEFVVIDAAGSEAYAKWVRDSTP